MPSFSRLKTDSGVESVNHPVAAGMCLTDTIYDYEAVFNQYTGRYDKL